MYILGRDVEGNPQKSLLVYGLMLRETRDVAERVLARLERLHAQYPSEFLRDAICQVQAGRDAGRGTKHQI
jgi:hypothetical protein